MRSRSFLTIAVVAAFSALAPSAQAQAPASCPGADVLPTTSTLAEGKVATLCLLNAERAAAGLEALRSDSVIERVADAYSAAMVAQQVFAHTLADGVTLGGRLTAYTAGASGYAIGENIGWGERELGTPRAITDAWMNSPGHRKNILTAAYREIGIGIVPGSPTDASLEAATYTTDFGVKEPGTTEEPVTSAAPVVAAPLGAARKLPRSCARKALAKLSRTARRTRTKRCATLRRQAAARRATTDR